jgi:transcriptional regulator with XRE-family HTH domain
MKTQSDADDPGMTLGRYLAWARGQSGLSVRQLEAVSGINRGAILRLENDEVEQPSADTLVRLAQVLELNETDVLLLARIAVPKHFASLAVMLRTEYGLPPEAIDEAKRNLAAIIEKYDGDHRRNNT